MVGALKTETPDKSMFEKELKYATSLHEWEKAEIKHNHEKLKSVYDQQIIELRNSNSQLESEVNKLVRANWELQENLESSETEYWKEKGNLIEEINRLSQEWEEIEALARENQAEVEAKLDDDLEVNWQEHDEELNKVKEEFTEMLTKT